MKLASLKAGGRDGTLIVVRRDLKWGVAVPEIAPTLQAALDRWQETAPQLKQVYQQLNASDSVTSDSVTSDSPASHDRFAIDPQHLAAPLPRAFQWIDGSAYVNHVELVRKARGASMPQNFWTDPLMYQGGSDGFLGPTDPIPLGNRKWGLDFEAEIAVITDDVPMGITSNQAGSHIQLLTLVNDVSLRNLIAGEVAKGFGYLQSKPASSFSPMFVTPDELGDHWQDYKVHLPLRSYLNGAPFGLPDAGVDMTFDFSQLISHAAQTRRLGAGTIIGSGTVSNRDRRKGSSCLAEKRMLEVLDSGSPQTPFLQPGDTVCIEMLDLHGQSIFGAIEQTVKSVE